MSFRSSLRTSSWTLGLIMLASFVILACTDPDTSPSRADESTPKSSAQMTKPATSAAMATDDGHPHASGGNEGETAPRNRNERPVPAFEGTTLAGTRLSIRDLLGSRIVLFFFNPEVNPASDIASAVSTISEQSGAHNFKVVGIGVGSDASSLTRFAKSSDLKFPVIDDSAGVISSLLQLRAPNAVLGVDAEGYMTFGVGNFPSEGDIAGFVLDELQSKLRLPKAASEASGALYAFPEAPALGVKAMSSGEILETDELKGRAAIVIFFLHTCPHCHHALASIKTILESMPLEQRPRLVAISIQNAPGAIRSEMKRLNLDFFDPYLDPGNQATERWGVTGGVPVVTVVDPEGRIRHRITGWNDNRDPGMLRMKVAKAAGARVPLLLDPNGYSGNTVCGVCHEQEYATWQYTAHASAFSTLVTHGANRRTDCVGCHVVGFEQKGGYDFKSQPEHLENVGCESCHGRGGPHLTPTFVARTEAGQRDYQQVCATCHNPKHSLGFDYEKFHPQISHSRIAALSDAERGQLLGGAGPARDLLPTQADYVGSDACQTCHQAEFATWEKSAHGHAVATLEKAGKAGDVACLECHTTAFGKTGGFPPTAAVAAHSDLARVGCESCHGPGGDHVGKTAKRVGTILSLGDKCDSCVILKICGTCHDDANDPGFQFKVDERIEAQQHGTIDAAATREDVSADRARLREAFEELAASRPAPLPPLRVTRPTDQPALSDPS